MYAKNGHILVKNLVAPRSKSVLHLYYTQREETVVEPYKATKQPASPRGSDHLEKSLAPLPEADLILANMRKPQEVLSPAEVEHLDNSSITPLDEIRLFTFGNRVIYVAPLTVGGNYPVFLSYLISEIYPGGKLWEFFWIYDYLQITSISEDVELGSVLAEFIKTGNLPKQA